MRAMWKNTVIAESDDAIHVDGKYYFPKSSVNEQLLAESTTTTVCPWKGTANYRSIIVDGERNADAMWYYADPLPQAAEIRGRVAFWKGVEIVD